MPAWSSYRPAGHMQPARFFAVDLFSQNLVDNWEFVGFFLVEKLGERIW